jgi:hypothetical protein
MKRCMLQLSRGVGRGLGSSGRLGTRERTILARPLGLVVMVRARDEGGGKPGLSDRLNPMKDADGDGKRYF